MSSIYKAYACLGNKEAPQEVIDHMVRLVQDLDREGWTLRTSGGEGPEERIEIETERKEIHLPWAKFNNRESKFCRNDKNANDIVSSFHPTFGSLKPAVQAIVARQAHVILGKDLRSPVRFLICWSEDGAEDGKTKSIKTGYMSMPIAIAHSLSIPIFNLKNPDALQRLKNYLNF